MSTLYEIQTQYRDLINLMESILSDPNPETLDADMANLNNLMAINAEEFQAKADAYAAVIREQEAHAEALQEEASRMVALAKQKKSRAEYLTQRIAFAMQEQGISKADTAHFRMSFRNSQAVEVSDQDAIPQDYMRTKTVIEPDKIAIKAALKQGHVIPGTALIDRQSLQIK